MSSRKMTARMVVALVLLGAGTFTFADDRDYGDSKPELSFPYFTDFEKPVDERRDEWPPQGEEKNPQRDWEAEGLWRIAKSRPGHPSFSGAWLLDSNPKDKTLGKPDKNKTHAHAATLKRNVLIPASSANPVLSFWHQFQLSPGDTAMVQVRYKSVNLWSPRKRDREWMTLKTYSAADNTTGYVQQFIPLDLFKGDAVRVRFVHESSTGVIPHWHIDDVGLNEAADLDADGIPDYTDPDIDGDGISNDYEAQVGTDPRSAASVPPDRDRDGIPDVLDADRDGDGHANTQDAFPDDAREWSDIDRDNIGDNADPDRDGDGISNDYETQVGTDPNNPLSVSPDVDQDGIPDPIDTLIDRDRDGVQDAVDVFPTDPKEWSDIDGDGIGDNGDTDRDGDGISNDYEAQVGTDPWDARSVPPDRDRDGIPDAHDSDRDGDSHPNDQDAFPDDINEWADLDHDGLGNNSDPDRDGDGIKNEYEIALGYDPNNATIKPADLDKDGIPDALDGDIDGDGVGNEGDAFPVWAEEWADSDGDGRGDNHDPDCDGDYYLNEHEVAAGSDPNDPANIPADLDHDFVPDVMDDDIDGDRCLNEVDAFPTDSKECKDTDSDGLGDATDPDIDNDGVLNAVDAFPLLATESADFDKDGIGDNADADRDGDGANNDVDLFPIDPTESVDADADGLGDNADPDRDNDGRLNTNDAFPTNPTEWSDLDKDGTGDNSDTDRDGDGHTNDQDAFPDDATQWKLPVVIINAPNTLTTVGASPIRVEGTLDDDQATLTLNGVPVTHQGGRFAANVALEEGHNAIIARAVDARGNEVTATVAISLDTTPPYLTLEHPTDGLTVYEPVIAVNGLINDIVRGTVSAGQANVSVNGIPATISNRSYLAQHVPLVAGTNVITVVGSDNVGNVGRTTATVTYVVPVGKQIELVSGQNQHATILSVIPQPLVVKLTDEQHQPVTNKQVVFRVTEGDGVLAVGTPNESQGVIALTDAQGLARTTLKLGSRAGQGNHQVRAKAVGFEGEVMFYASALPQSGDKVSVNSGNNQRGAAGQPLPLPFVVAITDGGANYVEGAPIEFTVHQGAGKFHTGETTYRTTTDSDGRASAQFILGSELGMDIHRVSAVLVGTELSAGFTASALKPGDPGQTSVSGLVLDNQDQPLANVTLRIDGTTRQATTNDQGQFKISNAPVGPIHLIADPSTTTAPGEWPTLSYNLVTVAGADNPLSAPIYLVKLDTDRAVLVGKDDATITLPEVPGFKLTVKKGSVTFPNGAREGLLSVTPVNSTAVPMAPPNGMQPQFIVTIQPTGAMFDPPAQLSLPNVDGHKPGAEVEMYSYDHDLEEFVAIGLGTVSSDGSIIESNPGVGVIKAGWHCGSQPGGSCCTVSCGECQSKYDCGCRNDDGKKPSGVMDVVGNCKSPACRSGAARLDTDMSDRPNATTHPSQYQCITCSSSGTVILDPSKAGSTCDDRDVCTLQDKCGSNGCKGEPVRFSINSAPQYMCVGDTVTVSAHITPTTTSIRWRSTITPNIAVNGSGGSASVAGLMPGLAGVIVEYADEPSCTNDTKILEVLEASPPDINTLLNKCPSPRNKQGYVPTVNGCTGVPNNPVGNAYYASSDTSFGSPNAGDVLPCNSHDLCYGTCMSDRDSCDGNFRAAMEGVCNRAYPANTGDPFVDQMQLEGLQSCLIYSNIYFSGVRSAGEPYWEEGQLEACQCCS